MSPHASKTRLICPLTASTLKQMREDMIRAARLGADTVECRLDYLHQTPTERQLRKLLADAPVDVIATNRPTSRGGHFTGDEEQRVELLRKCARLGAAFVDIEMDVKEQQWDDAKIILSHHDFDGVPDDLDQIVTRQETSPLAVNKIVFTPEGPEDALRALDVVRACEKPTIGLAVGQAGVLSRILAKKFGAFGTFAALERGIESAPGQPAIEEMKELYRWDDIDSETIVCGVIGCPVGHSMSPAIHNSAFTAAFINAVYVPILIQPGSDNFNRFMDAVMEREWLDWRGLSVTIPHKENALRYVGEANCDELACRIGAINTITMGPDGSLRGDNTDYAAAIDALCSGMGIKRENLEGRKVTVLGAGGVARAIVAALTHYHAAVHIYNRTASRGEQLAEEFHAAASPLEALDTIDAEIVINCTSIGMHPDIDASPLESIPPSVRVVFDTIYNPIETRLLREGNLAGLTTISGSEMFVNQAASQFQIWMDHPAPRDVMTKVVLEKLSAEN